MKKSFEQSQFLYYTHAQRTLRKKYGKRRKRRAAWKWYQGVFTNTHSNRKKDPNEGRFEGDWEKENVSHCDLPVLRKEVQEKTPVGKVLLISMSMAGVGQKPPETKGSIRHRDTLPSDGKLANWKPKTAPT
jgi:hypothetical protein